METTTSSVILDEYFRVNGVGSDDFTSIHTPGFTKCVYVKNYTGETIHMLDGHNKIQIKILPAPKPSDKKQGVYVESVWKVSHPSNICKYEQFKKTTFITMDEYAKTAVYCDHANVVICHTNAKNVEHPFSADNGLDYLKRLHESILTRLVHKPTYNIIVNDTSGILTQVYAMVNGKLCEITPAHLPTEGNYVRVVTSDPADNGQLTIAEIDFTSIMRGDCKFPQPDDTTVFIGRDKAKVLALYQQAQGDTISKAKLEEEIAILHRSYATTIANLKTAHTEEVLKLKTTQEDTIRQLKNQHDDTIRTTRLNHQQETTRLNDIITNLRAENAAYASREKTYKEAELLREKKKNDEERQAKDLEVQQHKTKQLETKTKSETVSLVGTVCKTLAVAIPVVAGITLAITNSLTASAAIIGAGIIKACTSTLIGMFL